MRTGVSRLRYVRAVIGPIKQACPLFSEVSSSHVILRASDSERIAGHMYRTVAAGQLLSLDASIACHINPHKSGAVAGQDQREIVYVAFE